jgi:hypothetical protein
MTGAELKAIRVKLACTPEAFALALGYSGKPQTLRSVTYVLETGRRNIPPAVGRLAVMLGRHGIPAELAFDGHGRR